MTPLERAVLCTLSPAVMSPEDGVMHAVLWHRLRLRYPQNRRDHLYLPWAVLLAFYRRHPQHVIDSASRGSQLAQELQAHVQSEDARDMMRRIRRESAR